LDNAAAAAINASLKPEVTQGLEVGGALQLLNNRLGLDVALYSERTSDLLIPLVRASGAVVANAGAATNKGIEAQISAVPLTSADGLRWEVTASFAKNKNEVESITGSGSAPMGPSRWGVTLEARPGYPLGAIVGTALRRIDGALALDRGLPVADSGAARVLGSVAPSWTAGLSNTLRFRGAELSALFDVRRGGKVFSATNMWGSYAGVLEATAFRPDSGLLIEGVNVATGNANTTNVSTQAYYHALGSITEPWVYDASLVKLREIRVSYSLPLTSVPFVGAQSMRLSLVGRNLALWSSVPNIDPETAMSTSTFQGFELGQLPSAKSVGIQVTLTP
jgi:outer membrane receptor protein involved in Fe transport